MKLKELVMALFSKNNSIAKVENNGYLSLLPPELLKIIFSHLDSKSLLKVRGLSKEHLEKVHQFLSHLETAKKFGLISLDPQDLIAVGENVMHRKYGISDIYGKPKEPSASEIQKSFTHKVTLFKTNADANTHIKKRTQYTEWDALESKPHQTTVTVKNPNTLFRMAENSTLSVRDEEITAKLTFK
ncbi:F-box protein [Legionella erythra]|uniref:F-box domain-containing protein n=2 Tax=Legionella erythra TaxID=448 RepID=A0A0W0TG02_LEGER|nr:F-box protein [Legionella erythra]KTC94520.1 hypothetical protein Lery_2687 [Legionella erythra]